ncbi:MAG: SDR family NAD(P)-dependent oxidoreductase [Brevundimonas sp.]|uniref:SDR family NAD(P)-dependent oxidoreductase n=1 Tax=Brevundimonas sp. TaxID=1871086 RepID=UPI0039196730
MSTSNAGRLAGRTALITGATGYLGTFMSRALAREGAHVRVNARRLDAAQALVAEIEAEGGKASPAVFDVRDARAVEAFAGELEARGEALHILINNAAAGRGGTLETASDQDYADAYDIAVVAAQRLMRVLLPALRRGRAELGDAAILNVSSMYGLVSPDLRSYDAPEASNPPFYGAAKAALVQLTRYGACQLGPEGIRCNAIAPGAFPSPATQQSAPDMVERLRARVPLGRIGEGGEIAGPVVFLCSPEASYITGAVLCVDGGWTAW